MEVDWIVGIMLFLLFVGWAFSYYFAIFQQSENQFELAADVETEKLMAFIGADVYEAPVRYSADAAVTDAVLKAKSAFYNGEMNATRVFAGAEALSCRLDGNDLYWQADLAAGYNYFAIKTAAVNTSVNCTASFPITSSNLTVPWAFEKKNMLSATKIFQMVNMSYDAFKDSAGINHDFNIIIEKASGGVDYGRSAPEGPVNVYSKKYQKQVFETAEAANVTVAIW